MPTTATSLIEAFKKHDLSQTIIHCGAVVDPDGVASQMALAHLIQLLDPKANITKVYRGSFDHPQNSTMRQTLNIGDLINVDNSESYDEFTCKISVDGPASTCPFEPDFIIDHHAPDGDAKVMSDIRVVGATSSLIWELLQNSGLITWESEAEQRIATALAIGIITDTRNGATENCTPLDYQALAACQISKDPKLFREILNYPLPEYFQEAYTYGWSQRTCEGSVLVTCLGTLPAQRSWLVPMLAEKYGETSTVATAVVFALVDGNIRISVRSKDASLSVNDFLQTAFAAGGGKRGAGAATIIMPPLFHGLSDEHSKLSIQVYRAIITQKALSVAGGGARQQSLDSSSKLP